MQQPAIFIVLFLLIVAASAVLVLDTRQRRMERHVATALTGLPAEVMPSIRRTQANSRWAFVYGLVAYRPGVVYLVSPPVVMLVGCVAAGAVVYANRYVDFPRVAVLIAAALMAVVTIRSLLSLQNRRFAGQLVRQLPDTISMITSSIRSGLPVNEAFRTIAREMPQPTAGQFAIVCNEMALGKPPEEAIGEVYDRTHVAEYRFFSVTLGVQMKSGGRLAETLQTLGDTVRERVAIAARAKALAAEVIFSSRALSVAPAIIGGLLYLLNPQSIDLLFYDPTGRKLLAYAVVSVLVGSLVIRWMVRRDTAL
jgi:tight adherence protein B